MGLAWPDLVRMRTRPQTEMSKRLIPFIVIYSERIVPTCSRFLSVFMLVCPSPCSHSFDLLVNLSVYILNCLLVRSSACLFGCPPAFVVLCDVSVSCRSVWFPSESDKAVADAVFSSPNHGCVKQSSMVCALIHVQPHRTLVERVESAHFLKMLSDETRCGWRVGTKCKFSYRRICLVYISAHQLDQRLYSSGDCGRAGLGSILIRFSRSSQY